MSNDNNGGNSLWPQLNYNDWKDTLNTVQLWLQIAGKIRLSNMPWLNHQWHVSLYVTPRGLGTGSIPYENGVFEINFDFVDHVLEITASGGASQTVRLYPRTVADFYKELFACLKNLGIKTTIHAVPNEIENAIPFEKDETHKSYDPQQINNYWQALVQVHNVFTRFRATFSGKCSPVHFFWGGFDLAVTRFSGKAAPPHAGGAPNMPLEIMQEAYSHEVSSCGFWPGSGLFPNAAFYSYCYPTPAAFANQKVEPKEAFYSKEMGEFLLLYDVVRTSPDPHGTLLKFLVSTYEAAANTGNWDREALECDYSYLEK